VQENCPDASSSTQTLRWHRRAWQRAMIVLLASIVLCGWMGREALLRGAATVWILSDPVTRADAIVVLGGDFQQRPFIAADLYRRGLADKVLISQTAGIAVGASPSNTELSRATLFKFGVPSDAIENFGTANKNTRDEALALREWAKRNAASAFIIPTEVFSARRVRWIFHRELSGNAVKIQVPSFEPPGYTGREWWKTEAGVIAFQNELLKYAYYRLKY
jgi:uncharacterized SAM-binding protein YcdF (DUF218 family)